LRFRNTPPYAPVNTRASDDFPARPICSPRSGVAVVHGHLCVAYLRGDPGNEVIPLTHRP
jgi:hypothetical protein